jgi:site-specific DNA-methyltransferase (adenine-specific)
MPRPRQLSAPKLKANNKGAAMTNQSITLHNQCSLFGMRQLPAQSVDLVLTDPPYGIADKSKVTKANGKMVSTSEAWGNDFQDAWPSIEAYYDWFKPFVAEMVRVTKETGSLIMFLDRKYTGLIVHYLERDFGLHFKNKIYFHKNNPVPSLRKNNYRSGIEEAVWFAKGKKCDFNFGPQQEMVQVYKGNIGRKTTKHPTEKYTWMIDPLLRNHCRPGAVVLDPFAGSGSVLARAPHFGHTAIGFEKSPAFYAMAMARLGLTPPVDPVAAKLLPIWHKLNPDLATNDLFYQVAA